ncbi:MAG: twin-arginine translocase subunit TatC [Planctomycetes bacterium]|nr:twin-arginine translocase subunit TatC [Planctomycetota bacterium]
MAESVFKRMTLGQHLEELRRRLMLSVVALGVAICACVPYPVQDALLWLISRPYAWGVAPNEPDLNAFYLGEPVLVYFELSLIAGLILSFPVVFYELWAFVAAGLHPHERRAVYLYGPISLLLFLSGVSFTYFFLLPITIGFLTGYPGGQIRMMVSLSGYVDFFLILELAVGVLFELPLLMLFLARLGLISPEAFAGKRRAAVLLAFVVSAIITPTPDPLTQTILALPLIGLYELGILLARLGGRARQAPEAAP